MWKILNPLAHGVLDYGLAVTFLLAPFFFTLNDGAAALAYASGFFYAGVSLVTRYPLGVVKRLKFPAHGVLEAIMALSWIAMPWLFGFADSQPAGQSFFVAAGLVLLGLVSLTDYRAAQGPGTESTPARYAGPERRAPGEDRRRRSIHVIRERRVRERRGTHAMA